MSTTDAAVAATVAVQDDAPTTPVDPSQQSFSSLPSTEAPASPVGAGAGADQSFKNDPSDHHTASQSVIPSSLTPPPSSQVLTNGPTIRASQRQRVLSPPVIGINTVRAEATPAGIFAAPRPDRVVAASPEELRAMLQACITEHTRLKTEAAHHKLQYQLLSVRADEDAQRAAVEQEMTLRQLEALRRQKVPSPQLIKRDPSAGPEITQAMYDQLRDLGAKALEDNEKLRRDYDEACKRLKAAKKLIVRQEEDMDSLREENEMLRNRLQDKRELWSQLASPGGIFHTPKTTQASPAQYRTTPRHTPKHRGVREGRQEPFAVLLQAATQENSSGPNTPVTPNRSGGRHPSKHSRSVQSLSSLPTTPNPPRPRGSDLLPAADLVPQTEPPRRLMSRSFIPDTPDRGLGFTRIAERSERGRHSRESTISADDNEELARAALRSVAQQATSFATRGSPPPRKPLPSQRSSHHEEDSQVYASQASQEASAMLRRDPRESLEIASSHNSRDVTPLPVVAEKSARLQSTLRGPVNKNGLPGPVKRKFDGNVDEARRVEPTSPTKRLRLAGGLREGSSLIGLGIRD